MFNLKAVKYYLASFCFVFILAYGYIIFVSTYFQYAGFVYIFSPSKAVIAFALIALLLLFLPKRLEKPSDFYINLILFLVVVPISLLYCLAGQEGSTFYAIAAGFVVILAICSLFPVFTIPKPIRVGFLCITTAAILMTMSVYAAQVFLAGRLYFNFSLLDVYDYRDQSNELTNTSILSYLGVWIAKVLIPLLAAISVWLRRYKLAVLSCLSSVLVFGISQHKSVIFFPYVVIVLIASFRNRKGLWILPLCLSVFLFLLLFCSGLADNILLPSLFLRRVFFVPARLTYAYYDFFSDHQFVYWSSSFLRPFVSYPYDVTPAKVIGQYLGTEANANNHFFATGFMHAGYAGLFIYCVLVGLILKLIDSLAKATLPAIFTVAVTVVPMFTLMTSADLPTALITHGLALSLFLLYLLRSSSAVKHISVSSSY
jgi:hypothetical protein